MTSSIRVLWVVVPAELPRTCLIADPGDLAAYLVSPELSGCWVRRGRGLVGLGVHWRGQFDTPAQAGQWWTDYMRAYVDALAADRDDGAEVGTDAVPGPVAFVSFPFDPGHTTSRCELIVPQLVIGRWRDRSWMSSWGLEEPPPPRIKSGDGSGITPVEEPPSPAEEPGRLGPGVVHYRHGGLDQSGWQQAVTTALEAIAAGQVDKVVLAREVIATTTATISPAWLLSRLTTAYPNTWTFAVAGLIGATPELLVRRDQGLVTSRVLAGTIRRGGASDAEDLAQALASSSKDLAEHEYAVASVAEALAPYCSGMNVPETPFVLQLPNVMHLATDITGVAKAGRDGTATASVIELAAAIHPSAAVCGTPTAAARQLIRQLEGIDRGRYAGPVGWIGADGDGEIGIALRCGQLAPDEHQISLYAGCGILAGSEPAAEWSETEAKLLPLKQALGNG